MKANRTTVWGLVAALTVAMLAGCGNNEPGKRVEVTSPTCEDLGKITDNAEHAALLAKCPDYLPGGAKKSKKMEW